MKVFSIIWRDCQPGDFEFLIDNVYDMDVQEHDATGWRDMSTGKKILDPRDVLVFEVEDKQETVVRLRFGQKMKQMA